LNKNLKYLLSLFLVLTLIVSDCTIDSQSKTADYYQVSFVVLGKELDFKSSRYFIFNQAKSFAKNSFSILLSYLSFEVVFSFHARILQKLQMRLHQNLTSFIRQSIFINELITSNNFNKSLYTA